MFHVMLIFLPILFLVIIGSMLLFGVTSILISLVGGASAALLIKNKTVKHLLCIGFGILLFTGSFVLLPFAGIFAEALISLRAIIGMIVLAFITILAALGIKISHSLPYKLAKTILTIVFSLIGVAAVAVSILIKYFLL